MATRGTLNILTAVLVLGVVIAVAAVIFFGVSNNWWRGQESDTPQTGAEQATSYDLVRDARGRPAKPYRIRLPKTTVQGLKVTTEPVRQAGNLFLPSQVGTLGYDTDRLYAVRPRFQGEIIELAKVTEYQRIDGSAQLEARRRPYGPGDRVHKGQVLAVAWSKELGDRKVALISALLDLYLDRELLARQEEAASTGSLPPATYEATKSKVQKDIATVQAAEASLGISRLSPREIEEIRTEAKAIQKRIQGKQETLQERLKRLGEDVPRWARVEIVAPHTGVIVEKNTNVNDMVDPSKDTPLYRIADLSSLMIFVNFNEEYLPLLQPLLRYNESAWPFFDEVLRLLGLEPPAPEGGELRWKVHIEAQSDAPLLDLPILRIAKSLDPNNHTALVIGRISNPIKGSRLQDKYLIVGQFVTATVMVPPGPDLVEIPTTALNEVNGESLVLVQPDPAKDEYALRRVAVVRRSREVTQVRSKLTPQDEALSAQEVEQGRRPIEPLRARELVVTNGVTEITDAFDGLLAKIRGENR
jgi:cobalt-zinc-cadmium efflux system membrane fusion protein